jgi:hypothetical protein
MSHILTTPIHVASSAVRQSWNAQRSDARGSEDGKEMQELAASPRRSPLGHVNQGSDSDEPQVDPTRDSAIQLKGKVNNLSPLIQLHIFFGDCFPVSLTCLCLFSFWQQKRVPLLRSIFGIGARSLGMEASRIIHPLSPFSVLIATVSGGVRSVGSGKKNILSAHDNPSACAITCISLEDKIRITVIPIHAVKTVHTVTSAHPAHNHD